ncbi:SEFIR domain-containing protein [Amycolatopsis sp. RTGN1]|uniref:SEFIR domain-containing protein n=1 Tax=Amycolatopsis ponsaeliensis TaxID=2992142 RepID=UPI00254BDE41|nr:SEFIR domain-containing protein [Amycolatopsis sp. RTGN1]
MTTSAQPRAFISYVRDTEQHCDEVREFAALLRGSGIDVELDQGAGQDRYAWALKNLGEADFVLVVASEGHRRAGDGTEASALRDLLEDDRRDWTGKLLPVILPGRKIGDLPAFLRGHHADHFLVSALTVDGVDHLLRHLTRRSLAVSWRSELLPQDYRPRSPLVEVHLVPAGPAARYGVPELARTCEELATLGTSEGLFSQSLSAGSSADAAWAFSPDGQGGECGLAVVRDGQRTCWFPLPGALFDREDLARQVSARLRTLLAISLPKPGRFAPGIGLDPVTATTGIAEASAHHKTFSLTSPGRIRIGPEESFAPEELDRAAGEIAEELVARLEAPLER